MYKKLREQTIIPNAREAWAGYRREVTDYIISNTGAGTEAAVFGAGRCCDIDLAELVGHFSKVTLFDIDTAAMNEAVAAAGCKAECITADFSGLAGSACESFERVLDTADTGRILEVLDDIYAANADFKPDFGTNRYDYAIVLGVNSQLNNMFEWICEASGADDDITKAVFERTGKENRRIVERFLRAVYRSVRLGGFLGDEVSRTDGESRVEGALQAFDVVIDAVRKGLIGVADYMDTVWPFDAASGKVYRMAVSRIGVNKTERR